MKWTRTRIRLKALAVPVLYFYVIALNGFHLIRAFSLSYVTWIGLSMVVDRYENEQRNRLEIEFSSFQRVLQQTQSPTLTPEPLTLTNLTSAVGQVGDFLPELNKFGQTECSICLDVLNLDETKKLTLPCGHQYHDFCIRDWLKNHNRCPICRRAAGGWDRVLEVVF